MRHFGYFGQEHHGESFRQTLEIGKIHTAGSAAGETEEYGRSLSTACVNSGDTLVFHVDSTQKDPEVKSMDIPGADGVFELVNGYVAIEEGCSLTFDGGKICIIDNGSLDTTVLPSHTDVWLIRTKGSDGISFNPSAYNDEYLVEDLLSDLPAMTRHRMPAAEIIDADTSGCATLKGELNVYTFHGAQLSDNLPSGGIYIANSSDVPVIAVPLVAAARQANSELAGITVAATYGGGQFADQ